MFDPVIS